MAKSKARHLAEIVQSDASTVFSGDFSVPSTFQMHIDGGGTVTLSGTGIDNSSLQNSSISINGYSTPLGGSLTLVTDDILEDGSPTNLYYTDARARAAISVSGNALSYNSTTGVISSSYEESPTFTGNVTASNLSVTSTNWIGFGDYGERISGSNVGSTLTFYTNATQALQLDSSQNATFAGTISSGAITSSGDLTISQTSAPVIILNDSDATNSTNLVTYVSFQRSGTESGYVGYGSSGNSNFYVKGENAVLIRSGSTNTATFSGSDSTFAGNVGVGTDPSYALHTEAASGIHLYLWSNTATAAAGNGPQIEAVGHDGASARTFGNITFGKENSTSGNYAANMKFGVRQHGGSVTTALTLNSDLSATFAGTLSSGSISAPSITTTTGSHFKTNTNANPLQISRVGSTGSEVLNIGITDTQAVFNYIEDTSSEGAGNYGTYVFQVSGNSSPTGPVTLLTMSDSAATFSENIIATRSGNTTQTALRLVGGAYGFDLKKSKLSDDYAHFKPINSGQAAVFRLMPKTNDNHAYLELWNSDYEADAVNYSRAMFFYNTSNNLTIQTQANGTGTAGNIILKTNTVTALTLDTSQNATFAGNVTVDGDLIITTTKQPGTYSDNWKTTKYVRAGAGTIGAANTGNAWVHLFTISNSSSYDKVHFIAKIGAFDDVGKGIEIIEAFYENTNAAQENHTIYWRKGGAGATYLFNEIRSIRSSSSGASNTYDVYAQITANWIDYFTVDFEYWVQSTSGSTVSFPSSDWTASAPSAGSDDRAETARRDYFNNITSDTLSTDNVSISGNGVLTFGDKTFNGYDIVIGNQTTARAMVFAPYATLGTRYSSWDTWIGQNTRPPIGTQNSGVELATNYIAAGASGLTVEFQQLGFYTWTPAELTGLVESDPLTLGTPKFLVDVNGDATFAGTISSGNITTSGWMSFGIPGAGQSTTGRFISIEGNADTLGEGSSRIFFTEHNSTTGSMSNYGMSLGYRGGDTSIVGADGNTWTGLSQIGNGEWGMWGHDNNATGGLIMSGDRGATVVRVHTSLHLQKTGTATAGTTAYNSETLQFTASGWDTNNSVARDVSWKIRSIPTASIYPDHDLTFIESDQGNEYSKFILHGRGSTDHTDPLAASFYGNVNINAGTGTNAGAGYLTVAGIVDWSGGSSTNANTAYTYSQVGHLPLAGGSITPSGWTAPSTYAALNIGFNGSGQTRAIDIDGSWGANESKAITFTHGSNAPNIVGQWDVQHTSPGSRMRWGKLYHGGDSSTYTMELTSTSTTAADLYINGSKVIHLGNDGSGTGLDADTLDGSHASAFLTSSSLGTTDINFSNGRGINFSAQGSGASTSNVSALLNDYERGQWTCTLRALSAEPATKVTATGEYQRVGDIVTVWITFNSVDTTGYSGACYFTLPYSGTGVSPATPSPGSVISHTGFLTWAYEAPVPRFSNSSNSMFLWTQQSGGNATYADIVAGTGKTIYISGSYRAAAS